MLCQQVSTNHFHFIKNSFSNMVSLHKFLIRAVSILTYRSMTPTNLKFYSYKYSSDQGRLNSFKHLSEQSIHINKFNIFLKVNRNHTLPKIVWTVVSTNFMFYKDSLRINVLSRTLYCIKLGNG